MNNKFKKERKLFNKKTKIFVLSETINGTPCKFYLSVASDFLKDNPKLSKEKIQNLGLHGLLSFPYELGTYLHDSNIKKEKIPALITVVNNKIIHREHWILGNRVCTLNGSPDKYKQKTLTKILKGIK